MVPQKSRTILVAIGIFALLSVLVLIFAYLEANQSVSVDELWRIESENRNLEEKTVTVRGDILFEPLSDFRLNSIYLVDSEAPISDRSPEHGFWFGIQIDGISCSIDTVASLVTCQPFDPSQATTFEFRGKIHLEQIGKKEIMRMSEVDFEYSRQLINGKWEPIPLGEFSFPLERK
jgi:hypothetical protein